MGNDKDGFNTSQRESFKQYSVSPQEPNQHAAFSRAAHFVLGRDDQDGRDMISTGKEHYAPPVVGPGHQYRAEVNPDIQSSHLTLGDKRVREFSTTTSENYVVYPILYSSSALSNISTSCA